MPPRDSSWKETPVRPSCNPGKVEINGTLIAIPSMTNSWAGGGAPGPGSPARVGVCASDNGCGAGAKGKPRARSGSARAAAAIAVRAGAVPRIPTAAFPLGRRDVRHDRPRAASRRIERWKQRELRAWKSWGRRARDRRRHDAPHRRLGCDQHGWRRPGRLRDGRRQRRRDLAGGTVGYGARRPRGQWCGRRRVLQRPTRRARRTISPPLGAREDSAGTIRGGSGCCRHRRGRHRWPAGHEHAHVLGWWRRRGTHSHQRRLRRDAHRRRFRRHFPGQSTGCSTQGDLH